MLHWLIQLKMDQQLWLILVQLPNLIHNRLGYQSQSFLFSLSLPQLALDWTLQPRSLLQIMSVFPLLPKLQMILNKSMASLMTQLMRYVIVFRHTQPQMNHSCFSGASWKWSHKILWSYGSQYMWTQRLLSLDSHVMQKMYLSMSNQLWPYGLSNASNFLTERWTNTRLDCACTEVN